MNYFSTNPRQLVNKKPIAFCKSLAVSLALFACLASVQAQEPARVVAPAANTPLIAAKTIPEAAVEKDPRVQSQGKAWRFAGAKNTDSSLPRALVVGDSILNGYLPFLNSALAGKVNLDSWVNPYCQSDNYNCRLADVLTNGTYAVVLINTGLHGWQPGRIKKGTFEPLTKAMVQVIREKSPDAQIVRASTTPIVAKTKPFALDPQLNPIIVGHNRMAAKVMADMNVTVIDYYALLVNRLELSRGDGFHWTAPAYRMLADTGAKAILAALAEHRTTSPPLSTPFPKQK